MSTPALGRSLELYYIDGRPDGMLTAEMFNWTGHVLMTPRTQIGAALARPEAGYAGVYLLLGEGEGAPLAYVGQSEVIADRIRSHDVNKDWWTSAVLVTTAGNKLNRAHVLYLEARLIEEAGKVGRVPLDNGNKPSRPSLSEVDVAKMEAFLDNLLIVLPALRVDMFIQRARAAVPVVAGVASPTPRFLLHREKQGLHATAVLVDGEFVVEAGSVARGDWIGKGSAETSYAQLYRELRRTGVLEPAGDNCRFRQSYAFRSPSAAAAIVTGRSANGTTEWSQEGTGLTYKEWEARQLAAPSER